MLLCPRMTAAASSGYAVTWPAHRWPSIDWKRHRMAAWHTG
jgi:hypothetical protein